MGYSKYDFGGQTIFGATEHSAAELAALIPSAANIAVSPTPFLDRYQPEAIARADVWRNAKETGGFSYNGKTFQSDPASAARIVAAKLAADLAEAAAPGTYTVTWQAADNSDTVLDYEGIKGLFVALAAHNASVFAAAKAAKSAIRAATTSAQIDAALAALT